MMFDATLSIADAEVLSEEDHGQLVLAVALTLNTPVGPQPLPLGLLRCPMNKATMMDLGQKMIDAAEKIEEPETKKGGDIVVAQNLSGVENLANLDKQMKKSK